MSRGLPRVGGVAWLGAGLAVATLMVLLVPAARLTLQSVPARVTLETLILVTTVGAALLLALLGPSGGMRAANAYVAALVVQAVTGLVFAVVPAIVGTGPDFERSFYPWLAGRHVAGALLVLAALEIRALSRRATLAVSLLVVLVLDLVIGLLDPPLPFDESALQAVSSDVGAYLSEFAPLVMFAVGATAVMRAARRTGRPIEHWLGLSLLVGVFTQIHEAMFPTGLGPVLTSADLLRLLAALLLAGGVVAQVRVLHEQRNRAFELLSEDLDRNDAALREVQQVREREAAFMSVVTHELTSPLAAINARGHVLAQLGDDRQRPNAEALLGEAARLSSLVDRMDELRQIEDPGFGVELRPVAVRPLLEEVAAFVDGLPGAERAVVDVEDGRILADPVRLGQVLRNLSTNAVRHSPSGSAIALRGAPLDDTTFRITVVDVGPGLGSQDVEELFRPYVRGDGSSGTQGAGLGLHLSRRIIEAHGGRISFDRPTDRGTRVQLDLDIA